MYSVYSNSKTAAQMHREYFGSIAYIEKIDCHHDVDRNTLTTIAQIIVMDGRKYADFKSYREKKINKTTLVSDAIIKSETLKHISNLQKVGIIFPPGEFLL